MLQTHALSRRLPNRRPGLGGCITRATLTALAGLACAAGPGWSQTTSAAPGIPQPPAPPPSTATEAMEIYEGLPIQRIVLRVPTGRDDAGNLMFEALAPELDQRARNNIRAWGGTPFELDVIRGDIARLSRLGVFSRVEVRAQLLENGTVDVFYDVNVQPIVRDVQVSGNRTVSDQELAAAIDFGAGEPVDPLRLDRAIRRIEELYRERGFYLVNVVIDQDELERGIVLFRITERERVRINGIRVEGNQVFTDAEIRRQVETHVAGLLRRGRLDRQQLDEDVQSILRFYTDRGYLDARADYSFQLAPNGREAVVTFFVEEGRPYTLREVRLEVAESTEGDTSQAVFTAEQVAGLIGIKRGDPYSSLEVRRAEEAITNALGQMGYADARARALPLRTEDSTEIDLLIAISQGKVYRTGEIIISGNQLTKKNVLLREVQVRPDRPLDTTTVERTERDIRRLNLFDPASVSVTLQPPDPEYPDHRDVLIEVAETNTTTFNFGGAVSSDAGLVGSISLNNRNFDIGDLPDSPGELFAGRAFRGAGQSFTISALPGDRIETYLVSFAEPALLESDYSFSGQVFYRDRDFDEFDEQRYGVRMGLGRRFGTRWNGTLNLRLENVALSDLAEDRPTDFFDAAENELIDGLGLTFRRTTIDNPYLATRGSVSQIELERVGLGLGDWSFTRIEASHTAYFTIREDFDGKRTVVSLSGNLGYIPEGRDNTPTFERFYAGGRSLRGLEFRTVSPRGVRQDNGEPADDPVGGTWQTLVSAEIRQPVFDQVVAVVAFIDAGTVTFDPGFDDIRVSVGFGLRVTVPQLSPAPLAFDFGFPISKEEDDEDRLFTFSVDVPLR